MLLLSLTWGSLPLLLLWLFPLLLLPLRSPPSPGAGTGRGGSGATFPLLLLGSVHGTIGAGIWPCASAGRSVAAMVRTLGSKGLGTSSGGGRETAGEGVVTRPVSVPSNSSNISGFIGPPSEPPTAASSWKVPAEVASVSGAAVGSKRSTGSCISRRASSGGGLPLQLPEVLVAGEALALAEGAGGFGGAAFEHGPQLARRNARHLGQLGAGDALHQAQNEALARCFGEGAQPGEDLACLQQGGLRGALLFDRAGRGVFGEAAGDVDHVHADGVVVDAAQRAHRLVEDAGHQPLGDVVWGMGEGDAVGEGREVLAQPLAGRRVTSPGGPYVFAPLHARQSVTPRGQIARGRAGGVTRARRRWIEAWALSNPRRSRREMDEARDPKDKSLTHGGHHRLVADR